MAWSSAGQGGSNQSALCMPQPVESRGRLGGALRVRSGLRGLAAWAHIPTDNRCRACQRWSALASHWAAPRSRGKKENFLPHLLVGVTLTTDGLVECSVDLLPRVELATHLEYSSHRRPPAQPLCELSCVLDCASSRMGCVEGPLEARHTQRSWHGARPRSHVVPAWKVRRDCVRAVDACLRGGTPLPITATQRAQCRQCVDVATT
jgi:hypothetical protein